MPRYTSYHPQVHQGTSTSNASWGRTLGQTSGGSSSSGSSPSSSTTASPQTYPIYSSSRHPDSGTKYVDRVERHKTVVHNAHGSGYDKEAPSPSYGQHYSKYK